MSHIKNDKENWSSHAGDLTGVLRRSCKANMNSEQGPPECVCQARSVSFEREMGLTANVPGSARICQVY